MVIGLPISLHPHYFDMPSGLNICNSHNYNEIIFI